MIAMKIHNFFQNSSYFFMHLLHICITLIQIRYDFFFYYDDFFFYSFASPFINDMINDAWLLLNTYAK